jgi:hypothetical protein
MSGVATSSIDIKLNAVDNTGSAFKSALENLKHHEAALADKESKGDGKAVVDGMLKGLFMIGMVSKLATDSVKALGSGAMDANAATGKIIDTIASGIPGLGEWKAAFEGIFDSVSKLQAAHIKSAGGSEAEQDRMLTDAAMKAKYTAIIKPSKN